MDHIKKNLNVKQRSDEIATARMRMQKKKNKRRSREWN